MPPLCLAPDVHLALVDDDLVFLDATRDDYLCVSRRHKAEILAAMRGAAPSSDLLDEVRGAGLLIDGHRRWSGPCARTACSDLDISATERAIRSADLARLGLAMLRTWFDLRTGRPSRWFARHRSRPMSASPVHAHDEAVRTAVALAWIRPLAPRSGRCLVRSLLLLHMLAMQGIRADWIFGVRTHPFNAHCWVEHQGVVLNDVLEHVRWYTPIVTL